MRSIFVLILLISFFFNNSYAQTAFSKLSELETRNLICHKWKLISLEAKNKKMNIPKKAPVVFLGFLPDGKMYEIAGNKEYQGTWSYNHSNKILTTNDQDGKEDQSIINLTNELFVMKTKVKGIAVNFWMQRVD